MMTSIDKTQDGTIPTRQDNTKAIRDGIPGRQKLDNNVGQAGRKIDLESYASYKEQNPPNTKDALG